MTKVLCIPTQLMKYHKSDYNENSINNSSNLIGSYSIADFTQWYKPKRTRTIEKMIAIRVSKYHEIYTEDIKKKCTSTYNQIQGNAKPKRRSTITMIQVSAPEE